MVHLENQETKRFDLKSGKFSLQRIGSKIVATFISETKSWSIVTEGYHDESGKGIILYLKNGGIAELRYVGRWKLDVVSDKGTPYPASSFDITVNDEVAHHLSETVPSLLARYA